MKSWWLKLPFRDRVALGLGGVVCFFYLYTVLLYRPLLHAVQSQLQQLQEKRETLAWMQQVKAHYTVLPKTQLPKSSSGIVGLSEQLKQSPLHRFSYSMQQTVTGDIRLSFASAPYQALLNWLWTATNTTGLVIKQLQLNQTKTPGVVSVAILLSVKAQ